jgi:hypothetical protein
MATKPKPQQDTINAGLRRVSSAANFNLAAAWLAFVVVG